MFWAYGSRVCHVSEGLQQASGIVERQESRDYIINHIHDAGKKELKV